MATKIVTVTELKAKLAGVMTQLAAGGVPVYVTQHGKPKAVLVGYEEYEALLEKLDDLEGIQAHSSQAEEAVSLEEYERQRAVNALPPPHRRSLKGGLAKYLKAHIAPGSQWDRARETAWKKAAEERSHTRAATR